MIPRVTRLVRTEFIKLLAHPFFYGAVSVLAVWVLLAVRFKPALSGLRETEWGGFNAIQLFSYGLKFGMPVAAYILLIFSSMMFAGEFDRGTIKNLLTRPITRTDLFAAKAVTVLLLGAALYAFVVVLSLGAGLGRGELGPVWDGNLYIIVRDYGEIVAIARRAVLLCFVPFLVAGFLGILVSNLTESSGYAVSIAMVAFIVGDLITGVTDDREIRQKIFFHYVPYVLDKLKEFGEGGNEPWDRALEDRLLYLKVPFIYMAGFAAAAYAVFRSRNIHA